MILEMELVKIVPQTAKVALVINQINAYLAISTPICLIINVYPVAQVDIVLTHHLENAKNALIAIACNAQHLLENALSVMELF